MVQGKINRGRHTDHPAGRHSVSTNQCPPLQLSMQVIRGMTRLHKLCWTVESTSSVIPSRWLSGYMTWATCCIPQGVSTLPVWALSLWRKLQLFSKFLTLHFCVLLLHLLVHVIGKFPLNFYGFWRPEYFFYNGRPVIGNFSGSRGLHVSV